MGSVTSPAFICRHSVMCMNITYPDVLGFSRSSMACVILRHGASMERQWGYLPLPLFHDCNLCFLCKSWIGLRGDLHRKDHREESLIADNVNNKEPRSGKPSPGDLQRRSMFTFLYQMSPTKAPLFFTRICSLAGDGNREWYFTFHKHGQAMDR